MSDRMSSAKLLINVVRAEIALTMMLAIIGLVGCSSSGSNNGIGGGGGTASVSIADATSLEGNNLAFIVRRSGSKTDSIGFSYLTSIGTAGGADFTVTMGATESIFAGGDSTVIYIPTIEDFTVEYGETLIIKITNVTNATVSDSMATGKIWDDDGVSYVSTVKPILATNCAVATCHGSGSSSGGYTMGTAAWATVRNAVGTNGAIVVPQDAGSSSLYFKTTLTPTFGARMPFNGPPYLTTEQQNAIRDWINEDAQDN